MSDVSAGNDFTAEKFFGRTLYAQRKCCLWTNGGLSFPIADFRLSIADLTIYAC
jgi:hypothetical protein